MPALRRKSEQLTGYLEFLLKGIPDRFIEIITPEEPSARGCQLSFRVKGKPRELLVFLKQEGAICDFREPNVLRAAPAPLYNSFMDVYRFVSLISEYARMGAKQ
jgi:kynureninase